MTTWAGVVLVVVGLTAGVAWPCSGPPCSALLESVPRNGATIPANAPAVGVQRAVFGVNTPDGGTWTLPPTAQTFTLKRVDGGVVSLTPVASTFGVFGAASSFTPGSEWELDFTEASGGCPGVTSRFVIGPAAPLPATSATLAFVDSRWIPDSGSSSCGASPAMQLARLRVTPTSDMEPWLALARWDLEVDGRLAGAAPYGAVPAGAYEPEATQAPFFLPINIVPITCQGGGITPGMHQVRLLARLEGVAMPIASNTLSLQIDCVPGGAPDAGVVAQPDGGDAGAQTDDPDGGRAIVIDGGARLVSGPVAPGCSASPDAALLVLGAFVLTLLSRRRQLQANAVGP